jgi:hypothetical protein
MDMVSLRAVLLLSVLVFCIFGCGPSSGGRQEVRGTIKLKGQPLDQGQILFMPQSGDRSTQQGALINNGAYKIDRMQGLMPGKYKVIITSGDAKTPINPDQPPGPTGANIISKDRIPPDYNTNSKQEVEVTDKKPNVFDFDIP